MPGPAKVGTRLAGHATAVDGLLESLFREASGDTGLLSGSPDTVDAGGTAGSASKTRQLLNDSVTAPLTTETTPGRKAGAPAPGWAEGGFRALLFRIGDFRFAMPLVLMRGVFELPGRLTRVPAQPVWHLGLTRYRGQSVTVADFGLLMGVRAGCVAPRYLLLIGDGRAAIACDGIEDAVAVDPQAVRWTRTTLGKAWLVGLMTQQMCGLLDADAVAEEVRHG